MVIPSTRNLDCVRKKMQIKADKAQEKYLRDTNCKEMYASEQRIKQGINRKTPTEVPTCIKNTEVNEIWRQPKRYQSKK